MYNPEKQARAPGGRFGGKKVTAERVSDDVKAVGEAVGNLASDAATMVERAAWPEDEALDTNDDGAITFDDVGRSGLVALFAVFAVIAVLVGLLTHCVG
jgi:hypothetical protein